MSRSRSLGAVALLSGGVALAACHPAEPLPVSPRVSADVPRAGAARATVVVSIVVDQLAAWIASERWPELPESGGFARLRREGTYVRDARFAHAVTETAPGHAALYTCAEPRRSGIVGNERLEANAGGRAKHVAYLRDATVKLVDQGGVSTAVSSSAAAYLLPTIADELRAARPNAKIFSISIKDRAAIPGGGRNPTGTVWYDPGLDRFVTSTAFATALPGWAVDTGGTTQLRARRDTPWVVSDRAFVEAHARTPDDARGEGAWPGLGVTFPHALNAAAAPPQAFRSSPDADASVLALATEVVRAGGFGDAPTLLALSLSANDYVGHIYGVDGWESWDNLVRLDAALAAFFSELDRAVGSDAWAAVLSADHGAPPMPETKDATGARPWCGGADRWERPCDAGLRLDAFAIEDRLERAAQAAAGAPPGERWILGVVDPYVVLDPSARASKDRAKVVQALVADLRAVDGVADAIDTEALPPACPDDDALASLVCRSWVPGAGDVYIVAKPGTFFDVEYVPGHGTNHGSPWLYDRSVPVLARDPGRVRAGAVVEDVESFETFARTVAGALGLSAPAACRAGRDLAGRP